MKKLEAGRVVDLDRELFWVLDDFVFPPSPDILFGQFEEAFTESIQKSIMEPKKRG